MKVVVASSDVPFTGGGARLFIDWLSQMLREHGHQVESVTLPASSGYDRMVDDYVAWRMLDLTDVGDRLIAVRLPSYAVRHHDKVAWFLHHHRPAFDMWNSPYCDLDPSSPVSAGWRGMLRSADDAALGECTALFSNSQRTADRLAHFNGLSAEVLQPPLWRPERYRCSGFDDTVVYPSRIVGHKRQDLLVRALSYTTTPVRVRLLGTGSAPVLTHLTALAAELGVADRVEIDGRWVDESEKQEVLSSCLAVAYLPVDEDGMGYPCLEAAHSSKPLLTTNDAGGTLEFARHRHNGLVVNPHPIALGAALDELWEARDQTRRFGENSRTWVEESGSTWEAVIARLLAPSDAIVAAGA